MPSGPFPVTSNGCLEHKAKTNGATWPPFSRQFYLTGGKTLPPWLTKKPPTNSAVHLPASPALPHLLLSKERRQVHHLSPRQVSVFGVNCLKKKGRETLQETKENIRGAERRGWHLVLWVDVSHVALCGRTPTHQAEPGVRAAPECGQDGHVSSGGRTLWRHFLSQEHRLAGEETSASRGWGYPAGRGSPGGGLGRGLVLGEGREISIKPEMNLKF